MVDFKNDFFGFKSHVTYYIKKLKQDPINAQPDDILKSAGFDGEKLHKLLKDKGIIIVKEKIIDHDKNKRPIKATYQKQVNVGLNPDTKIKRLWQSIYQENINESLELTEDGATSCCSVGGDGGFMYDVPLGGKDNIVRRKTFLVTEKQAEMIKRRMLDEEAVMGTRIGDFGYDAPGMKTNNDFFGPATARHNGEKGSISIPKRKHGKSRRRRKKK